MANEDTLFPTDENVEPQKKKRTRITKKEVSDHVYSVSGLDGENLEKPKRKRGRPSKAEKEAMLLAQALEEQRQQEAEDLDATGMQQDSADAAEDYGEENGQAATTDLEPDDEDTSKDAGSVEAESAPKRKRTRRTKEEIMAEAEARAEMLAQNNQMKAATVSETSFPASDDVENPQDVPEAVYAGSDYEEHDDENKAGLLEQLQNKVSARHEESVGSVNDVWEGDPADGTDFIIVNDLPIEDNSAIPYYDMLDNPQVSTDIIDDYASMEQEEPEPQFDFSDIVSANGLLEIMPDGYGFLRSSDYNYLSSPDDVHLTMQQIKHYSLKMGDVVECKVRPPRMGEKYFTMSRIEKVNGRNPEDIRDRISFENLTPLFPEEKFNLCGTPSATNVSTRIVDLFAPIGKGQRSLIVAQPKTGKTILMKDIANAIAANHPEAYIMMLLIDERPEEVTDMARTVNAEVIASTFDEPADRHVKIAGLVLEKAKRLVECGHDVVIFLDSITRLARAYNTVAPASGKVLTGGVDANALQKPKRFFGAARNIEGGGSLTIIATALTDTGSKMDEVIFEEFKGTGNSELQLDRQLANKRIFPAVNLVASSTRRDDLLLDESTVKRMWVLRNHISDMNAIEAMNEIHNLLTRTRDNDEFLLAMNS